MSIAPVAAIEAAATILNPAAAPSPTQPSTSVPFSQMVTNGIDGISSKILNADASVRAFTLDDSVPVHQVTFALEQARQSLELMMQMRARLVEAYQQLMNMQL